MVQNIAIVDYEMGNLKSVAKAFEHVGASVNVTREKTIIEKADKIVLPGVGAFGHCVENLQKYHLFDLIKNQVGKGKPFLGVCLGLQLLFETSEENDNAKGLGILSGQVVRFSQRSEGFKIPHMGWNQVQFKKDCALFKGIEEGSDFYFVHSYYVCPEDSDVIVATTDYGLDFCSVVQKDNVFACQFHPEKSQVNGLKVVENFFKL